ncbi:nuclear transport factor 2 family protein [Streptomyces sp. DSM 44915]|uniref:Nuclear transport factor 2 family protein n=1 Tax=Streptomyces chisholmiae TaxID=3075540 RepID=A0ABU2JZC0_9ACTN|nr:nuclear transport factor 2 family protein [Streptomyces sp. DSM 44915]MDT0270305.1 nuclear transport factor 2 family protein [Streptomyces sp. DSM 44915]
MSLTNEAAVTEATRQVATTWFNAVTSGDFELAVSLLDENVEWVNYTPVPGFNDAMPWIGTRRGPADVVDSLRIFTGLVDVEFEELVDLTVDGDSAMGIIHERSTVKETGRVFEIEFVQYLKVRDGQIVFWKSYTDPSQILRALPGR